MTDLSSHCCEALEHLLLDELVQLNDGSWKRYGDCDGDDSESLDAWHKRRYARALATRRLVRDGKWELLECDFLVAGGEFCGRRSTAVQQSGPVGEPRALCDVHSHPLFAAAG